MENNLSVTNINAYLKKNWFKISLFLILGFVILRKDFSFNFDLHTPSPTNIEQTVPKDGSTKQNVSKKEAALRAKSQKKKKLKDKSSLMDRFELPIFGSSKKRVNSLQSLASIDARTKEAYLKRFLHVARAEQKKFGIPSCITLANAFLHSHAGQRNLAEVGNNHFAITCNSSWEGESNHSEGNCYRQYDTAWNSFRDHSIYLTTDQFSRLRRLDPLDYKGWAKELERSKFSKERSLAKSLIQIIEKYGLHQL